MITVILIDNEAREKEEIVNLISEQDDIEVQGIGKDCYDAITMVEKYRPDIALVDDALGYCSGIEITYILKRSSPDTSIVMICSAIKDSLIKGMVEGTITGCVLNRQEMSNLAKIIRNIYNGQYYVNSQITARAFEILAGYLKKKAAFNGKETRPVAPALKKDTEKSPHILPGVFSRGELKILRYIADGYASKDIARRLNLKDGTVRNYVSSIMRKTGLKTRTQIVRYAIQNGIGKQSGVIPG